MWQAPAATIPAPSGALTLAQTLTLLGVQPPFRDAGGQKIPDRLLHRNFGDPNSWDAVYSSSMNDLRDASAHAMHAAISHLTSDPLAATAEAGASSARAHDRNVDLVAGALSSVVKQGGSGGAHERPTLSPAADFSLLFADGIQYALPVAAGGWAVAQRLPSIRKTPEQIEFVYEAYTLGETFNQVKLSATSARELMKTVGTRKPAQQFAGHAYFGVDRGAPRFGRNDVLEEQQLKGYFGKPKHYLKKLLDRARARGGVDDGEGSDL